MSITRAYEQAFLRHQFLHIGIDLEELDALAGRLRVVDELDQCLHLLDHVVVHDRHLTHNLGEVDLHAHRVTQCVAKLIERRRHRLDLLKRLHDDHTLIELLDHLDKFVKLLEFGDGLQNISLGLPTQFLGLTLGVVGVGVVLDGQFNVVDDVRLTVAQFASQLGIQKSIGERFPFRSGI